jgi:hypothetical protein
VAQMLHLILTEILAQVPGKMVIEVEKIVKKSHTINIMEVMDKMESNVKGVLAGIKSLAKFYTFKN